MRLGGERLLSCWSEEAKPERSDERRQERGGQGGAKPPHQEQERVSARVEQGSNQSMRPRSGRIPFDW